MVRTPDVAQVYRNCISTHNGKEWDIYLKNRVEDIVYQVPEEERDLLYAYAVDISCSKWYAQADLLPPIRYCDWQASYISMRPEIGVELSQWLEEDCLWIVTQRDAEIAPQQIADVIAEQYMEAYSNEDYTLYRKVRQWLYGFYCLITPPMYPKEIILRIRFLRFF